MKKTRNFLGRNLKTERTEDKITAENRSAVMASVRSTNTKFERDFIEALMARGLGGFETHARGLAGTPDIVFWEQRLCVFLDSDFWHGWQYPRWKHKLKSDFWREKIEKNRARDLKNTKKLKASGWAVLRLWEHNIKASPDKCIEKVRRALQSEHKPNMI